MTSLLQSFAVNSDGRPVSVREVGRGLTCACRCPVCDQRLIARQGQIRSWHFAHHDGSTCDGGAETALHLAAKEVVQRHKGITLPPLDLIAAMTTSAAMLHQPVWVDFSDIWTEAQINDIKPDLIGWHGSEKTYIEIAVTHKVDEAKAEKIAAQNVAAIEIALDASLKESWTWADVEHATLHDANNRRWIHNPHILENPNQSDENTAHTHTRLVIRGMFVDIRRYRWGLTLRSQYNPQLTPDLRVIARQLGGRWEQKYRNWILDNTDFVYDTLLASLENLGGHS